MALENKNLIIRNSSFIVQLPNNKSVDISCYLKKLRFNEKDIVICSGTLVEGIGNEFSDIDIYIITNKYKTPKDIDITNFFRAISVNKEILSPDSKDDILLIHLPINETGVKIDIEYKTFDDVKIISSKLNEYYNYALNNHILLTKEMPERYMSFIHRIHNCVCLYNKIGLENIRSLLNKEKLCYFLYRSNASDYADLLDIIGAWRKEELMRCFDLARENLIKQMLAYVCLIGNTDYKRKWILTRINQLPIQENIKNEFLSLYLVEDKNIKNYVIKSLDFIDKIYRLTAEFFEKTNNSIYPNRSYVLNWLDSMGKSLSKPYEIHEVQYRKRAYTLISTSHTKDLLESL